ncbi:hypothetical protein V1634_30410 [Plantactinospora veratri]|uniref:Uncharacterized protein n=1 Tax=Plantactinospora veratri TaxID=1436122 RepID=A0ABU7SMH0_9ACTN
MDRLDRKLRRERGYRRQVLPGPPPLPEWLDLAPPEAVREAVRLLLSRTTRRETRGVALVPDGPTEVAGYGLSVLARLVCADRRIRRRFAGRTWWLTAGPGARDKPGTAVRRHRRNVGLAGAPVPYADGEWSAEEDRILDMYRRLLVVVDGVPAGADDASRLLVRGRARTSLVTMPDRNTLSGWVRVVPADAAAVERSVRAALRTRTGLLPPGGAERLAELGVFAEAAEIPLPLVETVWRTTAGMSPAETAALCRRLVELSLIRPAPDRVASPARSPDAGYGFGRLVVDPVVRAIGRLDLGEQRLAEANTGLVAALAGRLPRAEALAGTAPDPAWWCLDGTEGYLWPHLVGHLLDAGALAEARLLAGDLRWVGERLLREGPVGPVADLTGVAQRTARRPVPVEAGTGDTAPGIGSLRQGLTKIAPLLGPTDPPEAVRDVLLYHLQHHPGWGDQAEAVQAGLGRPVLVKRSAGDALVRALAGSSGAWDVDLSADGALLAVAGGQPVASWLRLADPGWRSSHFGRREVARRVCLSPDGSWLAVWTSDGLVSAGPEDPPSATYVHVVDTATGELRFRLTGWYRHQILSLAAGADSSWLFTSAEDGDRAWDAVTGQLLPSLPGGGTRPQPDRTATTSPDGRWRATVHDNELRLQDLLRDRPGPMLRLAADRYDRLSGTVWLPDSGLLAYGPPGVFLCEIRC